MQTKHLVRTVQRICVKAFVQDKKYFKCNMRNQKNRLFGLLIALLFLEEMFLHLRGQLHLRKKKKSHLKALGCLLTVTFNQVQRPVGQQEIQLWHKQFYCNQVNVFNQFSSLKGALSSVAQALTLQLIGWDRSSLQSKNTVINFKSTSVLKRRGKNS